MILHFSMPAREPERVARILGDVIDGEVMPFPVVPGAWVAIARDRSGAGIEVMPEATSHHPGTGEADPTRAANGPEVMPWEVQIRQDGAAQPASGVHVALASPLSRDEIVAIGRAAGWRATPCERGGVFDLVELWVENRFLIEVLPPDGLARYRDFYVPDVAARMFAGPPPG